MKEPRMPLSEAKRLIHDTQLKHTDGKYFAATALMEACEDKSKVSLEDMLRCLDYGGSIAEIGARCLYVRTGRDDLGWNDAGSNGLPYIVDRADWEEYLRQTRTT